MNSPEEILRIMQPKPSPFPLVRIGGKQDGAYLVPDDLNGISACFSPGVANRKDFEDELVDRFGIRCHMCDYTSDERSLATPLRNGLQTFRKLWLDVDHSKDSISLQEWVTELEPTGTDLLLQMDIEGAEYRNLCHCSPEILARFRIILIELHGLEMVNNTQKFDEVLAPLLLLLDRQFICVHAHPNNVGGAVRFGRTRLNIPCVHELTFLRRDRFTGDEMLVPHLPLMPHPEDIDVNVVSAAPLFLADEWFSGGERPMAVRTRQHAILNKYAGQSIDELRRELFELEDRLYYLERRLDELHWISVCLRFLKRRVANIRGWIRRV